MPGSVPWLRQAVAYTYVWFSYQPRLALTI